MDYATRAAIRAIVEGLRKTGRIDKSDAASIILEMGNAAADADASVKAQDADMLRKLEGELKADERARM